MIKKGSKVRYIYDIGPNTAEAFRLDYKTQNGIFDVLDVTDDGRIVVRSLYNRAFIPDRKYNTDRYWVIQKEKLEEVPDAFQEEIDKLFEF
jgi:hypothetical protein